MQQKKQFDPLLRDSAMTERFLGENHRFELFLGQSR
jgi:hypothetical protein